MMDAGETSRPRRGAGPWQRSVTNRLTRGSDSSNGREVECASAAAPATRPAVVGAPEDALRTARPPLAAPERHARRRRPGAGGPVRPGPGPARLRPPRPDGDLPALGPLHHGQRLRAYWRARRSGPLNGLVEHLARLEDPDSALGQFRDRKDDEFTVRRLMELIEPEFAPSPGRASASWSSRSGQPSTWPRAWACR